MLSIPNVNSVAMERHCSKKIAIRQTQGRADQGQTQRQPGRLFQDRQRIAPGGELE
jgi:hypothetical protein